MPALKDAVAAGKVTVSKARKIVPVLTLENQAEWIERVTTLPQPKVEQLVAGVCPKAAVHEKAKYVTDKRLALQLGISEELFQKLKRVQDLESQRTKKTATLEETLDAMVNLYLEKNDPLEKAKRARQPVARHVAKPKTQKRQKIPAALHHAINLRDQSQCAHVDKNGGRCENRRWLEKHHLKPVSKGGTNTLENLVTLCWTHHRSQHATPD